MKIALIQPSFPTHIITPPLGLGYLASSLIAQKHKVNIFDCLAKKIDNDQMVQILKKNPPDLIGVSIMTIYFAQARDLIKKIKKELNIPIVIGGPHVSALPRFSLKETFADFATIGEAETTLEKLAYQLAHSTSNFSTIKGLTYKAKNGHISQNPRQPLIKNLNHIPFPAWNLLQPQKYPPAPHGAFFRRFPTAPIITTRGCPFNCSFCSSRVTWCGQIRFRQAKTVVDEIELLHKKYGIQEFHFEDDNFTANKPHALSICQEIRRRKLDIVWACPNGVRINCLDEELLKEMKASGCYLLAFGIESGSQRILDRANKNLKLSLVPKIIKMTKKVGIQTWGFFIIGLPGETQKSAEKTIEFARKLPLDRAQFCKFVPLPGTKVFEDWLSNRKLKDLPWENFSFFGDSIYSTKNLSNIQLSYFQKKAFRAFYFRPKTLVKTIFLVKPKQLKWLFIRLTDYFNFFVKPTKPHLDQ